MAGYHEGKWKFCFYLLMCCYLSEGILSMSCIAARGIVEREMNHIKQNNKYPAERKFKNRCQEHSPSWTAMMCLKGKIQGINFFEGN